jgi:putative DNA primase/helicase
MSLAPEHLADLRASGLTDETIDALQVEAVRPADINIKGATSAYTLPYFNFDGSVNCFARRKLFPPVKTSHGTMKYWQPKDSLPHLYLPPIADWQAAAKDVTTALTITEGEKKAAAACQQGLITAGMVQLVPHINAGQWRHTHVADAG